MVGTITKVNISTVHPRLFRQFGTAMARGTQRGLPTPLEGGQRVEPPNFRSVAIFSRGGSLGARLLGEASSAKGRTSSVRYLCRSCLNMYSTITSWANSTPAYLAPSVSQYEAQICLRQAAEKQKGYVGFRVQLGCDASRCRVDPCSAGTSYIPQFWREKTNISDHRQGSIQA